MADFREALDLFPVVRASRLSIRPWDDTYVDFERDCCSFDFVLHHSLRREGVDEEQASLQAQCLLHDTQSRLDRDQWYPPSSLH